jgi:hypothetical protein
VKSGFIFGLVFRTNYMNLYFLIFTTAICAPFPARPTKYGSPIPQPNGSFLVPTVPKGGEKVFKGF